MDDVKSKKGFKVGNWVQVRSAKKKRYLAPLTRMEN